jgi:hypothetical protein
MAGGEHGNLGALPRCLPTKKIVLVPLPRLVETVALANHGSRRSLPFLNGWTLATLRRSIMPRILKAEDDGSALLAPRLARHHYCP